MFDTNYYKKISILLVEDDISIQNSLCGFFLNIFKNVYTACDGQEGYEVYMTYKDDISIIISDINMPIKTGIEMVASIKEVNPDIEFILLTAYSDPKYMLEAIRLGVSNYCIKPVIIQDVMTHIQKICEKQYNQLQLINKTHELKEYLEIVNQVAIVSTTDTKGIITSVNDIFCETSGYSKEELLGSPHNIVRHPDMHKNTFEEMWNTIKNGHTWRGKLKNKAKNGEAYYVNANIFPLFEDDNTTIKGYMGVRFLTTELETEKRNFKQKVIQNLVNQKSVMTEYETTIQNLKDEVAKLKQQLIMVEHNDLILDNLQKEKVKNARLLNQLQHYESQLEDNFSKNYALAQKARESEQKTLEELKQIKIKYDSSQSNIQVLKNELLKKTELVRTYQERINDHLKTIANLQDVIKHRESQLKDNALI